MCIVQCACMMYDWEKSLARTKCTCANSEQEKFWFHSNFEAFKRSFSHLSSKMSNKKEKKAFKKRVVRVRLRLSKYLYCNFQFPRGTNPLVKTQTASSCDAANAHQHSTFKRLFNSQQSELSVTSYQLRMYNKKST